MSGDDAKIPFRTALVWILASTLLISGSAVAGLFYFQFVKAQRGRDDKYKIVAIVQTSSEKESLKTVFLAELLDLSIDKPANLYRFNAKEAKRKLLAYPFFKKVQVSKIIPGTLHIDYSLREPLAFLEDYQNTAIDADGIPFPVKPFFTPKKLPMIYLGFGNSDSEEGNFGWGIPLKSRYAEVALALLNFVSEHCCSETLHLRRIDVSHAFSPSYGQRQVVIVMENYAEKEEGGRTILQIQPHILRISLENYRQELANYLTLREYLQKEKESQPLIIDLRIPHLAFLKNSG